jgi:hypothetical protein
MLISSSEQQQKKQKLRSSCSLRRGPSHQKRKAGQEAENPARTEEGRFQSINRKSFHGGVEDRSGSRKISPKQAVNFPSGHNASFTTGKNLIAPHRR